MIRNILVLHIIIVYYSMGTWPNVVSSLQDLLIMKTFWRKYTISLYTYLHLYFSINFIRYFFLEKKRNVIGWERVGPWLAYTRGMRQSSAAVPIYTVPVPQRVIYSRFSREIRFARGSGTTRWHIIIVNIYIVRWCGVCLITVILLPALFRLLWRSRVQCCTIIIIIICKAYPVSHCYRLVMLARFISIDASACTYVWYIIHRSDGEFV